MDEIYVEGLVHITGLPSDYYQFDPLKQRLRGERSGRAYGMGDELTVIVARVDLDERKIDFELDQSQPDDSVGRKRKPRKRTPDNAEAKLAKSFESSPSEGAEKRARPGRQRKLKPAEKGRSGSGESPKRKRPARKKTGQ